MELKDSIPVALTKFLPAPSDIMYSIIAVKRIRVVKGGNFLDYVGYPDSIIKVSISDNLTSSSLEL